MPTADAPRARYRKERDDRLPDAVEEGDVSQQDQRLIEDFLDAVDQDSFTAPPDGIDTMSPSTLGAYTKNFRLVAKAADAELAEMAAGEINALMETMNDRLATNTVSQRQSALRVFYRFHDQLGVDPSLIVISRADKATVDARDTFDRDEVDAIRDELKNSRDRAILDMMLYTGQRIRAIQTLRVKDIDIEEGRFHLNTDEAGLKGAKGMRPLLLAKGAVSDWMKNHPKPDDDAYFFTKLPDSARGTAGEQIYQSTISRPIRLACKRAGIRDWKNRGHPHNLRHSFVRWAYVRQDMDVATIKYMGGWSQSSQTFEETYFNILDTEHAAKAEKAAGTYDGAEDDAPDLTPEMCPICDHTLPEDALACPTCGTQLPGGSQAMDEMEGQLLDAMAETSDPEARQAIRQLMTQVKDNPAALAKAVSKFANANES